MAEEAGNGAPSLEPPRLWRKRKPADDVVPEPTAAPDPITTPEPTAAPEPTLVEVPAAAVTPGEAPAPEHATGVDTPWIPAAEPTGRARNRAPKAPEAPRAPKAPRPAKTPRAAKAPRAPKAARRSGALPKPARPPRQRVALPPVEPHLAAAVTGLLVGGWLVLSTFSTLRMCESVRGASACGGPGLLLLLVIVAGGIALGASLLRYFKIRSAGSMSFLAVALVAVLVMLFFAGSLDQWWTIPVVAVLTVGAFSLSHWVTTTYIDPAE